MKLPEVAAPAKTPVVPQTADAVLLDEPYRSVEDVKNIEQTPLEKRLTVVDFTQRIDFALGAHMAGDVAITYVPDGDIDSIPERITFGTLRDNIRRTAALLRCHQIGRNDVVAILMPAVPAIYWSILGAMSCGIPFPVNWMLEPEHLLGLLREANTKAVIALGPTPQFRIWESVQSMAHKLPDVPIWSVPGPAGTVLPESDLAAHLAQVPDDASPHRDIEADSIAAYLHSGGTTGLPKIVRLSHRNLSYRHWSLQLASKAVLGEVILHDTPMFHVGGLAGRCLPPLASGASILIPSIMGARDKRYVANYWKFVARYRVTRLSGVPTTLATLTRSPPGDEDLSCLQPHFITGSTSMPIAVRDEFERLCGVRILNSYGLTENTASVAIDPRDGARKEGSSGIRVPYTKIRVARMDQTDGEVRECAVGEIGMLQITGPGVTPGYVNDAHERTARTADGWLITGDLGRIDEDGYVFVTGRIKDVIIRGGHNIDAALIEEALLKFPDVLHVAAVGKPDAYAGELPTAYVQLIPGSQVSAADLLAFASSHIVERAAVPKDIFIIDKIPLSDVGKPIKMALRRDAAERTFNAVLSDAIAVFGGRVRLEAGLRQHATKGTEVLIQVRGATSEERNPLTRCIAQAMSPFAHAYLIEWDE